ncbi:MAG TPA: porin, partial [Draconibacterium sp.]|nr:porin [Draconibacterium sp.]
MKRQRRKILKIKTIVIAAISLLTTVSSGSFAQQKVNWNGYAQLRFKSNFNDVNSFAMRRMKLWVKSAPEFDNHWGFKIQTTITSNQNEKFMLQDVKAFYQTGHFRINFGQFVPQYSLQRFQPDFTIPLTERTEVINALIPDGPLGVRDIGIEGNYTFPGKKIQTWFGIFNGNGIKNYQFNNNGVLLTHKTAASLFNHHLLAGYSVMYRKADHLQLKSVLPDSVQFSGNDFRYNVFTEYYSKKFVLQAEYLKARLNKKIADGYYVLTTLNLSKNQIVA